jgi:hypothetical protein
VLFVTSKELAKIQENEMGNGLSNGDGPYCGVPSYAEECVRHFRVNSSHLFHLLVVGMEEEFSRSVETIYEILNKE